MDYKYLILGPESKASVPRFLLQPSVYHRVVLLLRKYAGSGLPHSFLLLSIVAKHFSKLTSSVQRIEN